MSTLAHLNAQLLTSIRSANKELLQATLISMCENSPECLLQASSKLLVSKNSVEINRDDDEDEDEEDSEDEGEDEADESDDAAPAHNPKKRKLDNVDTKPNLMARYRVCRTCHETFDVTENDKEACMTHPGQKEIDVDYFPDDDEIEYGPGPNSIDVDNDWRVEQCPEGFPWDCCDKPADHEGCVVQRHLV